MTILKHKTPCNQCPFRQKSLPGWLGASTPEEFVGTALCGEHMPCHMAVNYDRKDWKKQLPKAAHCAGSLIFLRNCGSGAAQALSDPKLAAMQQECSPNADYENILIGHGHFIAHHSGKIANGK